MIPVYTLIWVYAHPVQATAVLGLVLTATAGCLLTRASRRIPRG